MARKWIGFLTMAVLGAAAGCNTGPFTDALLNVLILPRAIAVVPNNEFINPGQTVVLDGSQSGVLLGNGSFLSATQANLTFSWTIVNAIDRATNMEIPLGGTGATLNFPNSSVPTFSANTPADYNIRLTVTSGTLTGSNLAGVRVLGP